MNQALDWAAVWSGGVLPCVRDHCPSEVIVSGELPRNIDDALMMAMTREPTEADRREPIMMTPEMMFEGSRRGGKTNLMLECLKSADELNDAEARMILRNYKSPDEIVRDLQTILITNPSGRQTGVMSQWEYDMRNPPQNKPRSKRGQRKKRWR